MKNDYNTGLADGLKGSRRGRPGDDEASYDAGWKEGKRRRVEASLASWEQAREGMRECIADWGNDHAQFYS